MKELTIPKTVTEIQYAGFGECDSLWMKNDGTFAEVQSAVVDKDGYMTVKQSHYSSYVITTEEPTNGSFSDTNNNTNKEDTSPPTGDVSMMGIYLVMALTALLMIFVSGKKYNK